MMEQWVFWPLLIVLIVCYSIKLTSIAITGLFTASHPSYRHSKAISTFVYVFIALQLSISICACLLLLNTDQQKTWIIYGLAVTPLFLPEMYYYGMRKLCTRIVGKPISSNRELHTQSHPIA